MRGKGIHRISVRITLQFCSFYFRLCHTVLVLMLVLCLIDHCLAPRPITSSFQLTDAVHRLLISIAWAWQLSLIILNMRFFPLHLAHSIEKNQVPTHIADNNPTKQKNNEFTQLKWDRKHTFRSDRSTKYLYLRSAGMCDWQRVRRDTHTPEQ